ncbi:MAG: sensor histidine kinase [Anaerolineae bacterium]
MPAVVNWLLFAAVLLALLWWVRVLRRRIRLDEYRIARLERDAVNLRDECHGAQASLEALADASPEALLLVDHQRRVTAMNAVARTMFGGEAGRTVVETTRSHEVHQIVMDTLASGNTLSRQLAADDHVLRVQTVPVEGMGAAVSLQDLTELGRLARARRDFVSNISHELRTPLTSIKLLVETLLGGGLEDPEMGRRLLTRIETQVDTLEQLTQELFDLSEIESGRAPIRMTETLISGLVDGVMSRLGPQAERKEMGLENEVPAEMCALADAEKVERVLTNLLHNAIKFTPAGGRVWVRSQAVQVTSEEAGASLPPDLPADHPRGEWIAVSVLDTGPGIPPYHLPRIFERLYKVDPSRKAGEGTGLGLAIAKHIVEGHGGWIWAANREGGGAVFTFTLPACGQSSALEVQSHGSTERHG